MIKSKDMVDFELTIILINWYIYVKWLLTALLEHINDMYYHWLRLTVMHYILC